MTKEASDLDVKSEELAAFEAELKEAVYLLSLSGIVRESKSWKFAFSECQKHLGEYLHANQ